MQDIEKLKDIHIRTDRLRPEGRRMLQNISELDTSREGLLFLSQNLSALSIILPHMVNGDTSPEAYFSLAVKKAGLDITKLASTDYVIYGITTTSESDFDDK